jgi:hypothetical protein
MPRSLDESTAAHKPVLGRVLNDDALPDVLVRICELERRVAALEHRGEPLPITGAEVSAPATALPSIPIGAVPILGRALLGLAGAYLLRAIAESGAAPRIVTVVAALVYAGAWLLSSARTRPGETLRAAVPAVTAALIFVPLLWETTVRFHVLSPAVSALILVLFAIGGQTLAWRRDLPGTSRITASACAGTALGLLVATRDLAPFTIALLAMAVVAESAAAFGAGNDVRLGGRWIVALSNDISLLLLAYLVTRPQGLPESYRPISTSLVLAIQIATLALYVGSFSFRTIGRGLEVPWFEIAQATAIFAISIGGALEVTRGTAGSAAGVFCLVSGAAAYAAAFVRKGTGRRDLHTCALWGLSLVLCGSAIVFSGALLTAFWGALAIATMWAGKRTGHLVLRVHACVYLIGAAAISGLLRYCYSESVDLGTSLTAVTPTGVLAASVAALCFLVSGASSKIPERITAVVTTCLLCWSVLAFASGMLVALQINAVALPTLRTFLLCAVATGITWAGSRWDRGELLWLQYPVMVFAAAKLLLEDFPNGRPAALALSLLSYGGALILLPHCRLGNGKRGSSSA